MANPQNTNNTSEDSGAGRVSTTNSGQDGTSVNEALSTAQEHDQKQAQPQDGGQNPQTTSTQGNMGDGAGIRGDYGDSDQTNGMEGEDGADMRRAAEAGSESENSGK